ncbi:hypothetical protein [Streptomyces sp. NPDC053048]|uniref:hypothetical protein n=1 Tax=Streptomyces sp. NPDC053048 TaxID=3365694 RepID=UPI0037D3B27A
MNSCYVIYPTSETEPHQPYEEIVLAACRRLEIEPVLAPLTGSTEEAAEQTFQSAVGADLVIADVSGGNPRVMYLLGQRQASGRFTLGIGEHGRVPLEVPGVHTVRFTRTPRGLINARRELECAIEDRLLDGPVGTADALSPRPDAPAAEPAPEEDAEPGLLDRISDTESQLEPIVADLDAITESFDSITVLTGMIGAEVQTVASSGAPTSARLVVAAKYAKAIDGPSTDMLDAATRFASRMYLIDAGVRSMFEIIAAKPPAEREGEMAELLEELIFMANSGRSCVETLVTFDSTVEELGELSRVLRGPTKRIKSALRQMARGCSVMDDWEQEARRLLHP